MQLLELLYVRKLIIPMNRNTYYIYIRIATAYAISSAYIGILIISLKVIIN